MSKSQVVSYVDAGIYFKLIEFGSKNGFKTLSTVVNHILKEYFSGLDQQEQAVSNLNKVIQHYEKVNMELKSQIEHLKLDKGVEK